jgi:hypothetical protein
MRLKLELIKIVQPFNQAIATNECAGRACSIQAIFDLPMLIFALL